MATKTSFLLVASLLSASCGGVVSDGDGVGDEKVGELASGSTVGVAVLLSSPDKLANPCSASAKTVIVGSPSVWVNVCRGTLVQKVEVTVVDSKDVSTPYGAVGSAVKVSGLTAGGNRVRVHVTYKPIAGGGSIDLEEGVVYQPHGVNASVANGLVSSLTQNVFDDQDRGDADDLLTLILSTVKTFNLDQYIRLGVFGPGNRVLECPDACPDDAHGCLCYSHDNSGDTRHRLEVSVSGVGFKIDENVSKTKLTLSNGKVIVDVKVSAWADVKAHLWATHCIAHKPWNNDCASWVTTGGDAKAHVSVKLQGHLTGTKSGSRFAFSGGVELSEDPDIDVEQFTIAGLSWLDLSGLADLFIDRTGFENQARDFADDYLADLVGEFIEDALTDTVNQALAGFGYSKDFEPDTQWPGAQKPTISFRAAPLVLTPRSQLLDLSTNVTADVTPVVAEFNVNSTLYKQAFYQPTSASLAPLNADMIVMARHALINRAIHSFWRGGLLYASLDSAGIDIDGSPMTDASVKFLNPPIVSDPKNQNRTALFAGNILVEAKVGGASTSILVTLRNANLELKAYSDSYLGFDESSLLATELTCSIVNAPDLVYLAYANMPGCDVLFDMGTPSLKEQLASVLFRAAIVPLPAIPLGPVFDVIPLEFRTYMDLPYADDALVLRNMSMATGAYYPGSMAKADVGQLMRGSLALGAVPQDTSVPRVSVRRIDAASAAGGNTVVNNHTVTVRVSGVTPMNSLECARVQLKRCRPDGSNCSTLSGSKPFLALQSEYTLAGHQDEIQTKEASIVRPAISGCAHQATSSQPVRRLYVDSLDPVTLAWTTTPDSLFDGDNPPLSGTARLATVTFDTRLLNGEWRKHVAGDPTQERKLRVEFSIERRPSCMDLDVPSAPAGTLAYGKPAIARSYENAVLQQNLHSDQHTPSIVAGRLLVANLPMLVFDGANEWLKVRFFDSPSSSTPIGEYSERLTYPGGLCDEPTQIDDTTIFLVGNNARLAAFAAFLDEELEAALARIRDAVIVDGPPDIFVNVSYATGDILLGAIADRVVVDDASLAEFIQSKVFAGRLAKQLSAVLTTPSAYHVSGQSLAARQVAQAMQTSLIDAIGAKSSGATFAGLVAGASSLPDGQLPF